MEWSVEMVRTWLGGCALVNFAILLVWWLCFIAGRDAIHRLHGRWFRLSDERFDAVHCAGMAFYKLAILLFNLVPWLVLSWMGR
jgi:hypothetical protein